MKYPTGSAMPFTFWLLSPLHPDCELTSDKLAESVQTNPAYVRQLMSALRKGGLLTSVKGPSPAGTGPVSRRKLLYWTHIGR